MDCAHMKRTLKRAVIAVFLLLLLAVTALAQSAPVPAPVAATPAEDAGDPLELDPPPPPMALPDSTLRKEILVRGADGHPRVIAWLNGKIRVRDQHFGPNGERTADIEYRSERGEVAYWMLYHHNLAVKATYTVVNGRKEGDETRYDIDGHKSAIVRYRAGLREGQQTEFAPNGAKRTQLLFRQGEPIAPMKVFYATGEREAEVTVVNDRKHGIEMQYFRNGTKKALVPYNYGVIDGLITYFHESGYRLSTVTYKMGKMEGTEIRYYPNGSVQVTIPLVNNERHGLGNSFDEKKHKYMETPYVHGKIHGWEKGFDDQDRLAVAVEYRKNIPCCAVRTYFISGALATQRLFKDTKENGRELRYFDIGVPGAGALELDVPIVNGKKNGMAILYDDLPPITLQRDKIHAMLPFEDDKREGHEIRFYLGTHKRQSDFEYADDKFAGKATLYHLNGKKMAQFPFEDGAGTGDEYRWDEEGHLRMILPLVKGVKNGRALVFDEIGNIVTTLPYVNGELHGIEVRWVKAKLETKADARRRKKHAEEKEEPTGVVVDGDALLFKGFRASVEYVWEHDRLIEARDAAGKPIALGSLMSEAEMEANAVPQEVIRREVDQAAADKADRAARVAKAEQDAKDLQRAQAEANAEPVPANEKDPAITKRAGNVVRTFYEDHVLESTYPLDGNGMEAQYHHNGQQRFVVPLVHGLRQGTARIFDVTGTLWATIPFTAGRRDGVEVRYARTGEKVAEFPYKNGIKDGMARTWYPDSSKQSEYTFSPVGYGTETQYHKNGLVRLRVSLARGKRHGTATIYTEAGVKWAEVPFVSGLRDGTEVRFDNQGRRVREIVYEKDHVIRDTSVEAAGR